VGKASFGSLQSVVGLVAGLSSIAGGVYSAVQYVRAPNGGELVAVVRAADGDGPVDGATIEVVTPDDAVVTTLTPAADGRATYPLRGGSYVLRVSAPRFAPQSRQVAVQSGATAEVRFALAARPSIAVATKGRGASAPARAVDKGVGAAQRFFRNLGL